MHRAQKFYEAVLGVELTKLESPAPEIEMSAFPMDIGAVEEFRLSEPSGRVGHAELKFGTYTVMVSDEYPEYGIVGPQLGRPTGSSIHLHVDDVDAFTEQAVSAGAKLTMAAADQSHGERSAKVIAPFGNE